MSDTTFDTTPLWYGGPEGILKNSLERGRNLYRSEYQPYAGQRTAPFNDTQRKGFELAGNEANNPFYSDTFGQAGGAIRNALGQDVSQFIQNAIGPTNIDEFRNPYEQRILQNLQSEGNRNLQENLLPNINTKFIGAGQYGSTGHQDLTNRAIRDTQEGISKASGAALHAGYNTALQAALQKQESNLNAGQLAGKDIERQMLGAEALQNLAGTQQNSELKKIALLGQVGGQQQQQAQNENNVQYQEFQNEANFPYLQQARETEMIRGQPVSTQKIYDSVNPTPPQQPQASPYTQAGGMVMGLTGAMNQRPQGFAKGGVVKSLTSHRHFAEGGSLSPIQQGANHAIDTAELQSMRHQANKLSKPDVDPFWSSIARAGFNVAANRQPGVLAKLGEAGGAGLDEYHSQLGRQDNRGLQSAKIMSMIDNTRRLQEERNRSHQLERDKFGQHQKEFGMSHGLQQGQLGLAREKFEHEKGLYENGKKGLSSTKTKQQINESKKINEESKKRYEKIISSNQPIKKLIRDMRKANEEIGTNEMEGLLANIPVIGEPLHSVWKSSTVGQTPLDIMNKSQNQLVSHKFKSLPAKAQTVAHLNTLKQGSAGAKYTKMANDILNDEQETELEREVNKAKFALKSLKKYKDEYDIPKYDAPEIEAAYDNYLTEKQEWESTHDKAYKFPKKPEDYLEGMENESELGDIKQSYSGVSNETVINSISNLIE